MKAIVFPQYGSPNVLTEQEISIPVPGETEVLVEMYATSVNPIDCKIRAGEVEGFIPIQFPHVLGVDLAGVVKEVGRAVTSFKPGDRVFGMAGSGSYAAYAVTDEAALAAISPTLSFTEAGALPAVAITAWQALFRYGQLQQGDKVLIHAGAGGVGHIAIQLAKQSGAYVITTASAGSIEFVKELGADEVIDYTTADFSELLTDVDVVIDTLGGEAQERSLKVLKEGGRLIALAHPILSEKAKDYPVHAEFAVIQPNRKELEEIDGWVRDKKLKVHISSILPFTEEGVTEAHRKSETKHTKGKLVLQMRA